MGNCFGSGRQSQQKVNLNKQKSQRLSNWRATGTVSVRDGKLKVENFCLSLFQELVTLFWNEFDSISIFAWLLKLLVQDLPAMVEEVGSSTRTLDAANNKLSSLPPWLSSFTNLQRLILTSNQLVSLPSGMSALINLKVLGPTPHASLHHKPATFPPNSQQTAPVLHVTQVLMLDSNRLTQLPADIGSLKNLERLSVSGNDLTGLPAELGTLQKLVTLLMARNKLLELPSSLGQCVSLEEVDVTDNYLQVGPCHSLTTEIGQSCRCHYLSGFSLSESL